MAYRKSYEIIGYTADADIWCPHCALDVYGSLDARDSEGNRLNPIFLDQSNGDESCAHCWQDLDF